MSNLAHYNYFSQLLKKINSYYKLSQKKRAINRFVSDAKPESFKTRKRIIVWTAPGGMAPIIELDAILAVALNIRGMDIRFVICDGTPVACIMRHLDICNRLQKWKESCKQCERRAKSILDTYGFKYFKKGEFLSSEQEILVKTIRNGGCDKEEIYSPQYSGINLEQLALASTVRYSKGNHIQNFDEVLQEYYTAGLINMFTAESIIDAYKPDKILMSHATYIDWGTPFRVAVKKKIPVVVWNAAFEMRHFFFRTEIDDFSKTRLQRISNSFWEKHKDVDLSDDHINQLQTYFARRYRVGVKNYGSDKKINRNKIQGLSQFDPSIFRSSCSKLDVIEKFRVNTNKPVWAIFTHLVWEGIYNYGPILYRDESAWLIETINHISKLINTEWLIRIHPGELQYQNSKSALDIIKDNFNEMPEHIKIIAPDDNVNTVDILPIINGGITIFGTVGLELAVLGKPVILCGRGYYGDKGFTYDCNTESEYIDLLAKAHRINRLTEEQIRLARNYAYNYFLKAQLPIPCIKNNHTRTRWDLDLDKINLLKPHRDKNIDLICNGIINGEDFLLESPADK